MTDLDSSNYNSSNHILDEAKQVVYNRPDKHGDPENSFQTIAEHWNSYLRGGGIVDPNITAEDVANMMILLKISRNATGNYKEDNYVDIAGYAENGARLSDE